MKTTPTDILQALAAVKRLGLYDMNNPLEVGEATWNLGYEHESVWFLEWEEGADLNDENVKPIVNHEKYYQVLADLAEI